MAKIAVVTGGSGGIGLCTAVALERSGCTVYELSRGGTDNGPVRHITTDVTDPQSVIAAISRIVEESGGIDILVSNAGFGISGAAEFTDTADAHAQLEVNLFGMDNAIKAVIPVMRENGGGRIVCLSSVAAVLPIPFQLWYSVSKAAVNAYVTALANEVRPFGISVCAVMPGDMRTGFTAARRKAAAGDDVYAGRIERSVAVMERDEQSGMPPEAAGEFICRMALKKRGVKPLYVIGGKYRLFSLMAKLLPCGLVNRVVGGIYAR